MILQLYVLANLTFMCCPVRPIITFFTYVNFVSLRKLQKQGRGMGVSGIKC